MTQREYRPVLAAELPRHLRLRFSYSAPERKIFATIRKRISRTKDRLEKIYRQIPDQGDLAPEKKKALLAQIPKPIRHTKAFQRLLDRDIQNANRWRERVSRRYKGGFDVKLCLSGDQCGQCPYVKDPGRHLKSPSRRLENEIKIANNSIARTQMLLRMMNDGHISITVPLGPPNPLLFHCTVLFLDTDPPLFGDAAA